MATVNIRRDVDDKFYVCLVSLGGERANEKRYKMPVLLTKIEGRGNGIKTVIPNMDDVARALNRPATCEVNNIAMMSEADTTDPTKFFGFELGAQTTIANDRYIVNGAHQADRLRELLDAFIDKFVLCPSCKNPETEIIIKGKSGHEDMIRDCKACGANTQMDMRHKLVTFILKNPPQKKEKGKKGKKASGMTAEANTGGPMVFDKEEVDGEGDDESPPPGDQGVPTKGTEIDAILGRSDPVLANPDTAEEVSKKLAKLDVGDDDDDEGADSPYAVLGAWLEENKQASDADVIAKIKELEIVGKHKVLIEIGQHFFSENVDKEVPTRASLLQAVSYLAHMMVIHWR